MSKKYNPTKISKRQQALNAQRGLGEVWVDGSYFDQEGLAGGAAILCNRDGHIERTQSFELNHLDIRHSMMAELWSAAMILRISPQGSLGRLHSDCPTVITALGRVRARQPQKENYPPELVELLEYGVRNQTAMALDQVTRQVGKIPLADRFAKAAARGDEEALFAAIRFGGNHPHTHTPSPHEQ